MISVWTYLMVFCMVLLVSSYNIVIYKYTEEAKKH